MTEYIVIHVLIMICLVLFSAFFSATETAFSTLSKTKLKTMAEDGNKKAAKTLDLAENYDKLISTILIGNNIVNIVLASIGTLFFVKLYNDAGATISTVVITVVVLIFGEVTPKSVVKDIPEKFALFATPFIKLLVVIFTPINFIFSEWTKLLSKMLKVDTDQKMSQDELLMLVEEVEQDGSIDTSEGDLLRNAIEFTELNAEDILTHRINIEAVPMDATKDEIAQKFTETRFSRLLVYDEDIDHIVGVIHQKDFYIGSGISGKKIRDLISPAIFVHPSEKIRTLLKKLQKEKSHIAVVIDEYGGTLGIVTMEDILEELVGEIWDEHDEVVEDFVKLDDTKFRVAGAVNFDDFCDYFDIDAPEADSVSLGGWIMEQLDDIPHEGASFKYENLDIKVEKIDSHRVESAIVTVFEKEEEKDKE